VIELNVNSANNAVAVLPDTIPPSAKEPGSGKRATAGPPRTFGKNRSNKPYLSENANVSGINSARSGTFSKVLARLTPT
jgi:hypothetical protein